MIRDSMPDYIFKKTYKGIDFSEKELIAKEYENCRFTSCTFSNSDLSNIMFVECEFEDCNFSIAKISATLFRNVRFIKCKLLGLPFENCNELLLSVNFEDCQLDLASFYKLHLKNTLFKNCSLREADFTESDLSGSVFSYCDLTRAIFKKTILKKTDFRTSYNYSIDPEMNQIKKAKFSLSEITGLLEKYDIEIK